MNYNPLEKLQISNDFNSISSISKSEAETLLKSQLQKENINNERLLKQIDTLKSELKHLKLEKKNINLINVSEISFIYFLKHRLKHKLPRLFNFYKSLSLRKKNLQQN